MLESSTSGCGNMKENILLFVFSLVLALVVCLVLSYPVMWLWNNCLVPAVNTVEYINIWEALGILMLVRILLSPGKVSVTKK